MDGWIDGVREGYWFRKGASNGGLKRGDGMDRGNEKWIVRKEEGGNGEEVSE